MAYFDHWKAGAEAFKRVESARAAGRAPTAADLRAAIAPRLDPLVVPEIYIKVLTVTGDRAYLEADTESAYYHDVIVRVGGRWLIAGEDAVFRG